MKYLVKFKKEIFILLILILVYFFLRIPNLTLQPIFADEAIYIRWAQVMRAEPTLRFLPLSDGKTPLFMWSMIPLFKIFDDPLFAGRFLSVISGLVTLIGVMVLSWKVFGKKAALWSGLLYVVTPYIVFFDRMALVDSMLSAFTVWSLFFAILLAQKVRLDLAMILGFILGGAWLTKTSGVINLLLLPLSALAYVKNRGNRGDREDKYRMVRMILFWGVAIIIAVILYNALRLGPNFHLLSSRNADYVFSPSELAGRPLDPFIPHFRDISDWFPKLLTWPFLILGGIGVIWVIRGKNKLGILVLLWALIPLLINMAFLRTFTARYLLPFIPFFLIFAAFGLEMVSRGIKVSRVSQGIIHEVLVLFVIFLPLNFNYQLLTNPPPKSLPQEERKGYFEDWTAGYGFSEMAKFLIDQKKNGSVVVGTEGFFGTLPDGLQIYLDKSEIPIIGSHAKISEQIRQSATNSLTYFVGNKKSLEGTLSGVKLILEFPKVKPLDESKQDATVLYQVLP